MPVTKAGYRKGDGTTSFGFPSKHFPDEFMLPIPSEHRVCKSTNRKDTILSDSQF